MLVTLLVWYLTRYCWA